MKFRKTTAAFCALALCICTMPAATLTAGAVDNTYSPRDPFFDNHGANMLRTTHFQLMWGNSGETNRVTDEFLIGNADALERYYSYCTGTLGLSDCLESALTAKRDGKKYRMNVLVGSTGLRNFEDTPGHIALDKDGFVYAYCSVSEMALDSSSLLLREICAAFAACQPGLTDNPDAIGLAEAAGGWFNEKYKKDNGGAPGSYGNYLTNLSSAMFSGKDRGDSWIFLKYLTDNPDNLSGGGAEFVTNLLKQKSGGGAPLAMVDKLISSDMKDTLGSFAKRLAAYDFADGASYRSSLSEFVKENSDDIYTPLAPMDDGRYTVTEDWIPEAGGINIIPLNVSGGKVSVKLESMDAPSGADWRACIVVDQGGSASCSKLFGKGGSVEIDVPAGASSVYLTVAATPDSFGKDERYPYALTLKGADAAMKTENAAAGYPVLNSGMRGDVDENSKVDVADCVLLARFLANDSTVSQDVTASGLANADMDGNGSPDSGDLTTILRILARLE